MYVCMYSLAPEQFLADSCHVCTAVMLFCVDSRYSCRMFCLQIHTNMYRTHRTAWIVYLWALAVPVSRQVDALDRAKVPKEFTQVLFSCILWKVGDPNGGSVIWSTEINQTLTQVTFSPEGHPHTATHIQGGVDCKDHNIHNSWNSSIVLPNNYILCSVMQQVCLSVLIYKTALLWGDRLEILQASADRGWDVFIRDLHAPIPALLSHISM